MRSRLTILALIGLFGFAWLVINEESGSESWRPEIQFAPAKRGTLSHYVTASGAIEALSSVNISSQISGQVSEVLVDFNQQVFAEQPLAQLDDSLARAELQLSEAALMRAKSDHAAGVAKAESALAVMENAKSEFEMRKALSQRGTVSKRELDTASRSLDAAKGEYSAAVAGVASLDAAVKSAEASLQQAQVQLDRMTIRSPINGLVIERKVEVGQTVAATLQAPVLFVVAEDLDQVEVRTFVDEADIGLIRSGQDARFTVSAYADLVFGGVVSEIRKSPITESNVVSYICIIRARNIDQRLFPGMTASVRINVVEKRNVLKVPNAALRFSPRENGEHTGTITSSAQNATVWVRAGSGDVVARPVGRGESSDIETEIISGDIREGQLVATGYGHGKKSDWLFWIWP